MKTVEKIRSLALRGDVSDAITFALDNLRKDAPIKEDLIGIKTKLRALKRKREGDLVGEMVYSQELSGLIGDVLTTTRVMSRNPQMMKRTGIFTKWRFWIFLLLLLFFSYRYFTKPAPPPPDILFSFHTQKQIFQVGENAGTELLDLTSNLNDLFKRKSALKKMLGEEEQVDIPVVRFRENKSAINHTLLSWKNLYQKEVDLLESDAIKRFSEFAVYYDSKVYAIPEMDLATLQKMAHFLHHTPGYKLKIIGYADGVGSYAGNKELACNRANTVKDYLLDLSLPDLNESTFEIACNVNQIRKYDIPSKSGSKRRVEFEFVGDAGHRVSFRVK